MAKILLVEDDLMLLEMMKFRLEANGYEIVTAENGKDGSFKAMSEKPDLIITDIMMPELDGLGMVKIVRANSDLKKVPIIILSALGRDEDIKKGMDLGANDYISKPYSAEDLLKKIEVHLK